jgi:Ser-tRNA(Ala) deacylase AlaX
MGCGGTHLNSTGQITEKFEIKKISLKKGLGKISYRLKN